MRTLSLLTVRAHCQQATKHVESGVVSSCGDSEYGLAGFSFMGPGATPEIIPGDIPPIVKATAGFRHVLLLSGAFIVLCTHIINYRHWNSLWSW